MDGEKELEKSNGRTTKRTHGLKSKNMSNLYSLKNIGYSEKIIQFKFNEHPLKVKRTYFKKSSILFLKEHGSLQRRTIEENTIKIATSNFFTYIYFQNVGDSP